MNKTEVRGKKEAGESVKGSTGEWAGGIADCGMRNIISETWSVKSVRLTADS
jgi:hypothetical protein